jgi:hypothetical protein
MADDIYFAAKPSTEAASILMKRVESWTNQLNGLGYLDKIRDMWRAYHGAYFRDTTSGHQITFGGEQGELAQLPVNHFRNITQHIIVMTTSNRPIMQARATNSDYKSLVQTTLANNILDYYMREKHLEKYFKIAVEYAIVLGSGFIKLDWNASKGEVFDYIEETKTPIYEGDVEFTNLSPFDVYFDSSKESQDHDWYVVRSFKNRFDLAAKYPEYAERIKQLQTKTDLEKFKLGVINFQEETDDIPVFEFYHRRTESMEDGRYMMFVAEDIVLQDLPLPYRVLPIFRISASDILGTPFGYSPMFDLLPLQEAINSLYSTILTNQSAFGVQNVLVPRGSDIDIQNLSGGLNVVEYNATAGTPAPMNLTNTPAEIFEFIKTLESKMETLSGVNSVARGDPQASLKSGSALALVQSMALQFMSGLQQSYVQLIEDTGTGMIKILQDFASTPRLIAISGKSNRNFLKEFSSGDISNISRVIVDVGNPLARTTAGRVQMADNLLQYGEINPKDYVSLINTGSLDSITEDIQHEFLLISAENEKIVDGEDPPVTILDDHKQHIDKHRSVLADPELRKDPQLVARALRHIQGHIDALKNGDPELLMLMGQQPLQPTPPPPGQPGQQAPMNEQLEPPAQGQQGVQVQGEQVMVPGVDESMQLPNMPQVNPALLPNPELIPQG